MCNPYVILQEEERQTESQRQREGRLQGKNNHASAQGNQFLEILWHVASYTLFFAFDWYLAQI